MNYLWYERGRYWPSDINSIVDNEVLNWLESKLFLVALPPRKNDLLVTDGANLNVGKAKGLSDATVSLWKAVSRRDTIAFGSTMRKAFEAQIALFPSMINSVVKETILRLPEDMLGYKLSGADGGGYLVLFSNKEIENSIKVRIRRA